MHLCKSDNRNKIWSTEVLDKMVNGMIPDNFICKFKSNQEKIISNDKKFVEDTQVHSFIHSFIEERERERRKETSPKEKKHCELPFNQP